MHVPASRIEAFETHPAGYGSQPVSLRIVFDWASLVTLPYIGSTVLEAWRIYIAEMEANCEHFNVRGHPTINCRP